MLSRLLSIVLLSVVLFTAGCGYTITKKSDSTSEPKTMTFTGKVTAIRVCSDVEKPTYGPYVAAATTVDGKESVLFGVDDSKAAKELMGLKEIHYRVALNLTRDTGTPWKFDNANVAPNDELAIPAATPTVATK